MSASGSGDVQYSQSGASTNHSNSHCASVTSNTTVRQHQDHVHHHYGGCHQQLTVVLSMAAALSYQLTLDNSALRAQIQKKEDINRRLFKKYRKMRVFCASIFKGSNDDFRSAKRDFEDTVLIDLDADDKIVLRNQFKPTTTLSKRHTKRRAKLAAKRKKEKNLISSSLSTSASKACCASSHESDIIVISDDSDDSDELQLFEGGSLRKKASKCHSAKRSTQTPVLSSISKSVKSRSGALPREVRSQEHVVDDSVQRGDESVSVDRRTTLQQVNGGLVARPSVGRRPVVRGKGHGQIDAAAKGLMAKVQKRRSRGGIISKALKRKAKRRNAGILSAESGRSPEREDACSSLSCLTCAKASNAKLAASKSTRKRATTAQPSDDVIGMDSDMVHFCDPMSNETERLETETTSSENEPIMPQWTATRTQLAADTSEQFEDASVPSILAVASPPFAFRRTASGRSDVPPQTEPHSKSGSLATKLKPLVKISSSRLFTRKLDGSRRAVAQPLASHQPVAETRKQSTARMRVGSAQLAKSRAPQKVGLLKADDVKNEERIDAAKSEGLSEPQPVSGLLTDAQTVAFLQSVSDGSDDDVSDGSAKDTDSSSEEIRTTNFSAYPIPDISCFGSAAVTGNMVKAEASSSDEADVKPTDKYLPKLERED